jgi:hypothetical protein
LSPADLEQEQQNHFVQKTPSTKDNLEEREVNFSLANKLRDSFNLHQSTTDMAIIDEVFHSYSHAAESSDTSSSQQQDESRTLDSQGFESAVRQMLN